MRLEYMAYFVLFHLVRAWKIELIWNMYIVILKHSLLFTLLFLHGH
jgi:hypothetical protein